MEARPPLLRMEGISKRFPGVAANREVTLEVARGEVHALLGENGAGKTTLMNILYGLVRPDAGRIVIDGEPVRIDSPRRAAQLGIGMVHQHFMLVPTMTVAENIALAWGQGRSPLLSLRRWQRRIEQLAARHGLQVRPSDRIEDLSVGAQQRVEILKLLAGEARLLILDEPTAVLTPGEWEQLAGVLRELATRGKTVILITHKLHELMGVADRCTVLRHGQVVATVPVAGADVRQDLLFALARMMVGRDLAPRVERSTEAPGATALEAKGLVVAKPGSRRRLDGITFALREREILGIAGVDGNGQRELVEALSGLRAATAGTVRLAGVLLGASSPGQFLQASGAVIPEDRQRTGVALDLSLLDNLMIKDFATAPFARLGWRRGRAVRAHCLRLVEEYDVRAPHLDVPLRQLSGGNQQKVVLARELSRRPRVLIAFQPTRGLDVAARDFVHRRLLAYRQSGGAVLLVSTDLDEVLALSDRIAVMVGGRFARTLGASEADRDRLGLLMSGAA